MLKSCKNPENLQIYSRNTNGFVQEKSVKLCKNVKANKN